MGALKNLIPLLVLFVFIGVGGFIGYHIYVWSNEMADRGRRKMEKKNVVFTKDGMKVGIKNVSEEEYASKQQNYFVKAWNYSSMPAYKSRFWNKEEQARQKELAKQGKSTAVESSPTISRAPSSQTSLNVPKVARPGVQRTASNPGAFPDE
ncbi:hypothetical protein K461DRAFT_279962 [Myriangium duriaei CBS 260.36]|uniref:Uncharacterized protein n=1 Tax=Myriangium duriaei CBS 260.36 TaxID=1168546 RepID=A0A9P4IYT7_9PEZI|nr:hypothetical protein K461DRAFT_279962 [Myriangium duriaei CBS 260.36]